MFSPLPPGPSTGEKMEGGKRRGKTKWKRSIMMLSTEDSCSIVLNILLPLLPRCIYDFKIWISFDDSTSDTTVY